MSEEKELSDWLKHVTPFRLTFITVTIIYWYIIKELILDKIYALMEEVGPQSAVNAMGFSLANANLLFQSLICYLLLMLLLAILVRRV